MHILSHMDPSFELLYFCVNSGVSIKVKNLKKGVCVLWQGREEAFRDKGIANACAMKATEGRLGIKGLSRAGDRGEERSGGQLVNTKDLREAFVKTH